MWKDKRAGKNKKKREGAEESFLQMEKETKRVM